MTYRWRPAGPRTARGASGSAKAHVDVVSLPGAPTRLGTLSSLRCVVIAPPNARVTFQTTPSMF